MSNCLFCKMAAGEIKPAIVYENDDVLAFKDINPQAPVHLLVIPRTHVSTINDLTEEHAHLIGKLALAAKTIANQMGFAAAGYRAVMNCNGDGGQSVFHIHMHVLAGRPLGWPPFPVVH